MFPFYKGVVSILDGGFASQLEADGMNIQGDPLWSARALITNPDKVVEIHKRYLTAGATIIETASYQAALPTLRSYFGFDGISDANAQNAASELIRLSVQLARRAVDEFCLETGRSRQEFYVAGSVGPYAVVLHDGSEYSGQYVHSVPHQEIVAYHLGQATVLSDAGVDILAFETVPSLTEAKLILEALQSLPYPPVPTWISFSCRDGTYTSAGDRFADVVSELCLKPAVSLIGINCTAPQYVTSLLKQGTHGMKPFVVYPNIGEQWDHDNGWQPTNENVSLSKLVPEWISRGVKVVGGCCRVGPNEIKQMADILTNPVNISDLNLTG